MFDWQTVVVALVVLAALLYVARRAQARLRSLRASGAATSCETSCGSCGGDAKPAPSTPAKVLVQIGRGDPAARRRSG